MTHDNFVFILAEGRKRGLVSREGLGEFEQLVLLAILHLESDVYGIPIMEEIERRTGRSVARAAVYVTLRRLEGKKLVSSWMGEATLERRGKARRYVTVTPAGIQALQDTRQTIDQMWRGLHPKLRGAR
jgi:PadR family transcriptional regulator PadR